MGDEPSPQLDVFVSYSNHDKNWAIAVCAVLERHRLKCWIAPRDITPGREWGEAIIQGLNVCQLMVLVFSRHANASGQVRREVERAISRGMTVLSLRVEDIQPAGALEYALGNTHWLDAFTPTVEQKLELLAKSVLTLLRTRDATEEPAPREGEGRETARPVSALPAAEDTSADLSGPETIAQTEIRGPIAVPGRSIPFWWFVFIAIVAASLGLGLLARLAGFGLFSTREKPSVADVARAIRSHFKETIGLPPTAEVNSMLGEKRLIQAIFFSLPVAGNDLAIVSDALRTLNDQNFFQSEGFLDVHLESVVLQLATIRDVRIQWLTEMATSLQQNAAPEVELPRFCQLDPSISPKPTVRLTTADLVIELENLKHVAPSP